jgi:hypothetical protein
MILRTVSPGWKSNGSLEQLRDSVADELAVPNPESATSYTRENRRVV